MRNENLKFIVIAFISFAIAIFLASPLIAIDSSLDLNPAGISPPSDLSQPRPMKISNVPELRDIEAAQRSISDNSSNQRMRIPLPSSNSREYLVAESTINPRTGEEIPITVGQNQEMFQREAALRIMNSKKPIDPDFKKQSTLLASMDLNNIAQYRSCVFVDSYGTVYDKCKVDLVVRDHNSGRKEIIRGAYIDRFCVYVMKSCFEETWF